MAWFKPNTLFPGNAFNSGQRLIIFSIDQIPLGRPLTVEEMAEKKAKAYPFKMLPLELNLAGISELKISI